MSITRRRALLASALAITMLNRAKAEKTIKIGVLANMGSSEGRHPVNGATLAVEDINKAGGVLGRPVELVVEDLHEVGDRQALQANAVAAFGKLATQSDIVAFIGPDYSLLIHAMSADVMSLSAGARKSRLLTEFWRRARALLLLLPDGAFAVGS